MSESPKLYLIERKAPRQVLLSDFGLTRDEHGRDVEFRTTFRGAVSIDEFAAMFGPEANVVHSMILSIDTRDHWNATIGVEEVLACEREEHSMQHVLINALRERAGLTPFSGRESLQRARAYDDIHPDVAQFLMEMYIGAYDPQEVDLNDEMERFIEAGLTLDDLCK